MTPVGRPMTINDVVVRTAVMFVPLLITAYLAWTMQVGFGIVMHRAFVALGFGFWGALSKTPRPLVSLAYAAVEGVVSAAISFWMQDYVNQSQLGQGSGQTTNIVAAGRHRHARGLRGVLFLYGTRIIKVTGRFKKMMMIAMIAYLGIADRERSSHRSAVSVTAAASTVSAGSGILLCAAGVALASFSLVLDFDAIEKSIQYGLPERSRGVAASASPSPSSGSTSRSCACWRSSTQLTHPHGKEAAEPFTRSAASSSVGRESVAGALLDASGGAHLVVLVHDGGRVAVRQGMFVLQPMDAFLEPRQCRTVLHHLKPLVHGLAGCLRQPGHQVRVGLFGVVQRRHGDSRCRRQRGSTVHQRAAGRKTRTVPRYRPARGGSRREDRDALGTPVRPGQGDA